MSLRYVVKGFSDTIYLFVLVSITLMLLTTVGCGSPESKLIGKWSDEKNQESVEFFKDKTCVFVTVLGNLAGKWIVLDDGRIKIDVETFGTTQIIMGRFQEETLMLEMGGRQPSAWHKVKGGVESKSTSGDWDSFFAEFRTAVHNRNREALKTMMASSFEYGNDFNVPPDKVYSELDYDNGANWALLEKTIAKEALPYKLPNSQRPARVAKYSPSNARYEVWVTFEFDENKQWHWRSIIFPGD